MDIDPKALSPREAYFLLTALVVPRPIAWVSTFDPEGRANLAPHSYFNAVSSHPPIVQFVSTHSSAHDPAGRKDTLRNVEASRAFVINIVSEDLLEAMNRTAIDAPPGVDEFALAGLEAEPARAVRAPRLAAAKAMLECRLRRLLPMGDATVVFGDVVHVQVSEAVWRAGRVDIEALRPVGRLSGAAYATLGQIIHLPRPSWAARLKAADERS